MSSFLDRFLASRLKTSDPDTLRRARLAAGLALVLTTSNAAYMTKLLFQGAWSEIAVVVINPIMYAFALLSLKRFASPAAAANFIVAPMVFSVVFFAFGYGGVHDWPAGRGASQR
jgi:hypothetical protein